MALVRLATLGDSITANPGFDCTSWPEVLLPQLDPGSTLSNFAVSGYNTNQLLPIFEASIRNGAFDVFAVMAGVNDLRTGTVSPAIPKETTIANLRQMWTEAAAAGKRVVAFTITPHKGEVYDDTIYGDLWNASLQADQEWLNDQIRADAAAYGYGLVDAYDLVGDAGDPAVLSPTYGNADGIHLNQAGENLLATFARSALLSVTIAMLAGTDLQLRAAQPFVQTVTRPSFRPLFDALEVWTGDRYVAGRFTTLT